MPDPYINLAATPSSPLPSTDFTQPLPKIDFSQVPQYIEANPSTGMTSSTNILDQIKPDMSPVIQPQPFDNKNIAKVVNSSAFPELGYNRNNPSEESRYDAAQSNGEAIKNTLIKTALGAKDGLLQFFGQHANTLESLSNLDLSKSWSSDADLKALKEAQDRDNTYPTFQSNYKPGWWSYIPGFKGSGDTYEKLVPQLGYTLGAMVGAVGENAVIDGITGGLAAPEEMANSASSLYSSIASFSNFNKSREAIQSALQGSAVLKGINSAAHIYTLYNTAASFVAPMAAGTYNEMKSSLTNDYVKKNGYAPIGGDADRIEQESKKAGNADYLASLPVAMATDAVQFRNVLFPSYAKAAALKAGNEFLSGIVNTGEKLESKFALDEATQAAMDKSWKTGTTADKVQILASALGSTAAHITPMALQQAALPAVGEATKDYYTKEYNNKDNSAWDSLGVGLGSMMTHNGLMNFLNGAVMGAAFSGAGAILKKMSNPAPVMESYLDEEGKEQTRQASDETGQPLYKFNFLNKLGFFSDTFTKEQQNQRIGNVLSMLNHDSLKDMLKEEGFRDLLIGQKNSDYMDALSEKGDMFNMNNIKSNAMNRFLYAGLVTGRLDLKMEQLNDVKNLTPEEFSDAYGFGMLDHYKTNMNDLVDYVQSKAEDFQKIYDTQSKRLEGMMGKSWSAYKKNKEEYTTFEDGLKKKYGTDDLTSVYQERKDYFDDYSSRYDKAQDFLSRDALKREMDDYRNSDKFKDTSTLDTLREKLNQSYIDYVGLNEGKKASIFAASDMLDSSGRANDILRSLESTQPGTSKLRNLLDPNSIKEERKILSDQHSIESDPKSKKSLEKRMALLDTLKDQVGNNDIPASKVAGTLHDYLRLDTPVEGSTLMNSSGAGSQDITGNIRDLVSLQRRHQANLDLFNRLNSTGNVEEYGKHESEKVKEFYNRAMNDQTPDVPDRLQLPWGSGTEQQGATQEEPKEASPIDKTLGTIRSKVEAGNPLSDEDRKFLSTYSSTDPNVFKFYKNYLASQEMPYKVGDTVLHNGAVSKVVGTQVGDNGVNKFVALEGAPNNLIPIEDVQPYTQSADEKGQVVHQTQPIREPGYQPEPDSRDAFDSTIEEPKIELHRSGAGDTRRTIVNEVSPSELSKPEPSLTPGYTAWKQSFLDRMKGDDLLGRYTGKLVVDTKENYPEDSNEYKYLESNPMAAGLVLVVTDKNGNDRFNQQTYQPDTSGLKVVHSLPNSDAKSNLLGLMKEKGIESIPVDFSSVSQGIFDERDQPVHTEELVSGISKEDYEYTIAKGLRDQPYVAIGGTTLRNGGAYLKVKGSYIKILPERSINLRVGEVHSPNVADLLDMTFTNLKGARNLTNFLETLFYTDSEKGGLAFRVNKIGDTFYPQAVIVDGNSILPMAKDDMKATLKTQRINIVDSLIGQKFDFYHMVDGKPQIIKGVDYNDFLAQNTLTNKKAYSLEGKKVLKPVNRYLTFSTTLEDLVNQNKEQVPSLPGKLGQHEEARTLLEMRMLDNKVPDNFKHYAKDIPELYNFINREISQGHEKLARDMFGDELVKMAKDSNPLTQDPVKKRTRFDTGTQDKDTFGDIDKLFKKNQGETGVVHMLPEAEWLVNTFGKDVAVQIKKAIDSGAWGEWTQAGITLLENAPEGTGYHEGWHNFSQLYLTPDQRQQLYDEFKKNNPNHSESSPLQTEEAMAEDFRQYALNQDDKQGEPVRNSIFKRIWEFLKNLFGINRSKLQGIYSDLYEGRLAKYEPSINNAEFGKLNSIYTDDEGKELLNNQKSYRYTRQLDSMFGQILADGGITTSQLSTGDKDITRQRLREVYKQMYTNLKEKYNNLADREAEFEAKNPGQASPLSDTLDDLEKLINNFPAVVRQHIAMSKLSIASTTAEDNEDLYEYLRQAENNQPVSVEEEENNEKDNAGKGWDKAGNETSVIDSSSAETKSLIRGLSKVATNRDGSPLIRDGKTVLFENEFGLNEPVNYTQMFNNLGNLLEGSYDLDDMMDKMKNQDNQRRFPETALLLERLPNLNSPLKFTDVSQLTKFFQDFAKTYIPIYTLVKKMDGGYFFKEETKRTRELIQREWSNNFVGQTQNSRYVKKGDVMFDENGKPYLNPNLRLNYDFTKESDVDDFLGLLGINIGTLTKKSPEYKSEVADPVGLSYLAKSVKDRLAAGQRIDNPVKNLSKEYSYKDAVEQTQSIYSENNRLNRMLELESKYSTTNPSMSYRNARGDMQYGLSLNNWLTASNYWLSRTNNYQEIQDNPSTQHLNIDNNPYIRNSLILNRLFNLDPTSSSYKQRRVVNGQPVTLTLGNYNGFKEELSDTETIGEATTSLPLRSKIVMDLNSFLTNGATEIMRTESSASAFFLKLSDYSQGGAEEILPVNTKEIDGDPRNEKVMDYFRGALKDEMATIINLYDSPLPNYKANIGKFTTFDGILSDNTKEDLIESLGKIDKTDKQKALESIDDLFNKNKSDIDNEIGQFLEDQVKETMQLLKDNEIDMGDISTTLRSSSLQDLVTSFVLNNLILNSEYTKLFSGNLGFYKAYHKRSKGDTSTGKIPTAAPYLQEYLQNDHTDTLAGSMGVKEPINLREVKTLVLKDDVRQSPYTDGKGSAYKVALTKLNPNMTSKEIDTLMKAYDNMNVADGQGHCTYDFYRQLRMQVGNWSYADEVQYKKEVIGFRQKNNLQSYQQKLDDAKYLEDYKDVSSYSPPMKMQYNGALKVPGVFAPVLDKFSVAPLIPSVIEGTPWEHTNRNLLEAGIGYTKFESGTKKYKYPPVNFYDSNWNVDIDTSKPATHFAEGLKEQIATSSKIKDESTWGTQMRKLFLANMFSSGSASEKFQSLLDNYTKLMDDVMNSQKQSLYKEFGMNDSGDVQDVKQFFNTLKKQVDKNNLNDNIKDFLQYDKDTKQFRYPLEISLNKAQIQDLISGMVFKKLTRLKVNGDALIQVASSGFEKPTNAKPEDVARYGNRDLKFYEPQFDKDGNVTGTKAMQVKVALAGEWLKLLRSIHADGQKIGSIDRLNEMLKHDGWMEQNRKKVQMVGYRIPTQGPNSMEVMEVAEFLPSVAGSIVILPPEIVAKAGSDYDIDKMFMFRPSLTANGEMAGPQGLKEMESQIKSVEQELRDYKLLDSEKYEDTGSVNKLINSIFNTNVEDLENDIDNTIYSLDKNLDNLIGKYISLKRDIENNTSRVLTNKVMDIYRDALLSPEMFTQLITPNNTISVKNVADDLINLQGLNFGDFKNTDVLKYSSNATKFQQLLGGKGFIGAFAKANTMSQLLQQSGMTIGDKYKIAERLGKNTQVFTRNMTLQLLTPEERGQVNLSHANEDGSVTNRVDFSSNKDVLGHFKQDIFSQLVNGTVDIAADPWFMGLGLNQQTITPMIYMEHLGIPFSRSIAFLNQPIIKEYVKDITNLGSLAKWNVLGRLFKDDKGNPKFLPKGNRTNVPKGPVLKHIEEVDNSRLNEGFYFNEHELRRNIEKPGSSTLWFSNKVLAHFLKMQEQGRILRDLQTTISFDTQKFLSPVSANNNLRMRDKVKDAGLFDEASVNKIRDKSMISAFNNVGENVKIFSQIMPTGSSKRIINASSELMDQFQGDRSARIRLERVIGNDWMEFIIKNFGSVDGTNIEDYSKPLLLGNNTLSQQLAEMKGKYPKLSYFEAFRRLYPNNSDKTQALKNIELYRGLDNTPDYQNVLIEELNQLSNFQGTEIPGAKFTPAESLEIQKFFGNLAYLAFQQSGFNRGPLFFTDVIPHMQLTPTFSEALRNYQRLIKENPQAEQVWIDSFIEKFKEQNPSFGFTDKKSQSWRGKWYGLKDEAPVEDTHQEPPTQAYNMDYDEGDDPSEGSIDDLINNC